MIRALRSTGRAPTCTRLLSLAIGALVVTLSSCSTFESKDEVASVNGSELTRDELNSFVGTANEGSGDAARTSIGTWVVLSLLEDQLPELPPATDPSDLGARQSAAVTAYRAKYAAQAQAAYETGFAGSPVVCFGVIPVADEATGTAAMQAIDNGATFAEAAQQFSNDPTLAANGGVAGECQPTDSISPEIEALFTGVEVGVPFGPVNQGGQFLVLQLRPFAELTPEEQASITPPQLEADVERIFSEADVHVDSRFGRWDPTTGSVIAPA